MKIKIIKANPAIDKQSIADFEKTIGQKLPEDYRKFLNQTNGGEPEDNCYDISKHNNSSSIRWFLGIGVADNNHNLLYHKKVYKNRIPEGVIPIAYDDCGNCTCLSLRPDTYGKVYFWDHELEANEGKPASFNNLFWVANSFSDFLKKLKKPNPKDIPQAKVVSSWVEPGFLESLKKKEEDNSKG